MTAIAPTSVPQLPTTEEPPEQSLALRRENRDGWILVSPTIIIVTVIVIIPVLWNVVLAFQSLSLFDIRTKGLFGNFTLDNFKNVFSDPDFWSSLWTTVIYSAASTIGSIVVGLVAALALRRPFPGRGVLRAFMLLPYVAPVVAATFVWKVMLDEQSGIINHWGTTIFGWANTIN